MLMVERVQLHGEDEKKDNSATSPRTPSADDDPPTPTRPPSSSFAASPPPSFSFARSPVTSPSPVRSLAPSPSPSSSPPSPPSLVDVSLPSLVALFRFFLHDFSVSRSARFSSQTSAISSTCVELFSLDYHCATLPNTQGEYCSSYPPTLVIIESARQPPHDLLSPSSPSPPPSSPPPKVNDAVLLSSLFKLSRFNRVHGRFLCPVLMVRGVNLSRSSTLSVPAEAMFNSVTTRTKELLGSLYGSLYESIGSVSASFRTPQTTQESGTSAAATEAGGGGGVVGGVGVSARAADEELLQRLGTRYIFDLMVEQRKRKMGVTLTSSEKIEAREATTLSLPHPHPYEGFTIVPTPYPGCEFFSLYHFNHRSPVGLVFDWSQGFVDSLLQVEGLGAGIGGEDGLDLSDEGEGEESFYDNDTHWPCWEKLQNDTDDLQPPHPIPTTSQAAPTASSSSLPRSAPPTSVPTVMAEGSSRVSSCSTRSVSSSSASLQWRGYKEWSVVTLTKNYLLLLLRTLCPPPVRDSPLDSSSSFPASSLPSSSPTGVALHCVSGWDRTPLFISLLRLSLWADGEVHPSLSPCQMLYLTLAYDWCLFSHHLHHRHGKNEDILYFTFDFLQFIASSKFSSHPSPPSTSPSSLTPTPNAPSPPPPLSATPPSPAAAGTLTDLSSLPALRDGYFTASGHSSTSSSASTSAPIPIPSTASSRTAASSSSSTSPPFTSLLFLQAASLSPPSAEEALLLSSSSSPSPTSSSSAPPPTRPRGGSWTMVDVLSSNRNDEEDSDSPSSSTHPHQRGEEGGPPSNVGGAGAEEGRRVAAAEVADAVDESSRRRAALRCERLMAVRSLFLSVYHTTVPHSPVPSLLSTAPTCPHFRRARLEVEELVRGMLGGREDNGG